MFSRNFLKALPAFVQAVAVVASLHFPAAAETPAPPLVIAIQTLLAERGYSPGPADGRAGARTVAAIQAYQRSIGAVADGRPTPALLERLAGDAEASTRSAAAPPGGQPDFTVPLIDSTWEFVDASGSVFRVRFDENGAVHGPGEARFWRWQLTDAGILITYDNDMGTRIVRQGRFLDGRWLNGVAHSSAGRQWDWVANRIETPPKPGK